MAMVALKKWTTQEASAYLGIDESQVRRYAERGEIPGADKHGRAWMFDPDGVKEFGKRERVPGNPAFRRK